MKGNKTMLNSIQRTSNYQNSRPNFGMALSQGVVEALFTEAGEQLSKQRDVKALARRAFENKAVNVVKDTIQKGGTIRKGTSLYDALRHTIIPDTFIKGRDIKTVTSQVQAAEILGLRELSTEVKAETRKLTVIDI